MGDEGQLHRTGTGRDDGVVEGHCGLAVGAFHFEGVRAGELAEAVHNLDFTHLGHAGQTAGQLVDDLLFPQTHLVDVGLRGTEDDAVLGQRLGFFDHFGNVQQRLGGDAAHVQADATQGGVALDDNGIQTQIGGTESSGITGRASTQYYDLSFDFFTHHDLFVVLYPRTAQSYAKEGGCSREKNGASL
ncbi:hypothetical protein D3C86_1163600 [compost metagenome]